MAQLHRAMSATEQVDLQKRLLQAQDEGHKLRKENEKLRDIIEPAKVLIKAVRSVQSYDTFWTLDEMTNLEKKIQEYENLNHPSN